MEPPRAQPVGYARIIRDYGLPVPPPARLSFVAEQGGRREQVIEGRLQVVYPPHYDPGDTLGSQLEFSLKHDGVDLAILGTFFSHVPAGELEPRLAAWIRTRPTGQYARRLWFLYEHLTGRRLPVRDVPGGSYVPLLKPDEYYTAAPRRSRRHLVLDNLLGDRRFCPVVRRTPRLDEYAAKRLDGQARRIVAAYDADTIRRAVSYLYTKETRSSFSIEGEKPSASRAERYVSVLRDVPRLERLDEATLVRLQNAIVSGPFADEAYRADAVYVGESIDYTRQRFHYVAPRPQDVPELMAGWLACLERMSAAGVEPVVQAAAAAFGFVFVHPFRDGNGRLHRLLIHYVLSRTSFTPQGLIFPISAVMLQRRREYDDSLESFSKTVMPFIEFDEHPDGTIDIRNDTAHLYRHIDFTRIAEDLWRWTEETIRTELKNELDFVVRYRKVRSRIEEMLDLPARELNLFIRLVLQNHGHLSANKRRALFARLPAETVQRMEQVVREGFGFSRRTRGASRAPVQPSR